MTRRDPVSPAVARAVLSETAVNHWDDYGGVDPRFRCEAEAEFCHNCGRQLVAHTEPGTFRSRRTGQPTYVRYHSCPTWVEGWRTSRWARGWACPGMGHDSHDADNPMSARSYR
jgi:hypothetical protein